MLIIKFTINTLGIGAKQKILCFAAQTTYYSPWRGAKNTTTLLNKGRRTVNWDAVGKIISSIVELPATVLITAIIAVLIFLGGIGVGIGLAFRDIPMHISRIVTSFFNFILSMMRREQIDFYPQNSASLDIGKKQGKGDIIDFARPKVYNIHDGKKAEIDSLEETEPAR